MNIRSIKLFGLSALLLTLLTGTFSIQAQQIVSDNKVDSDPAANSGALKANSIAFKDDKASKKTFKTDSAAAPAPSGYDWTGAYIGAHAGYGWGKADTDFAPLPSAATFINLAPTTLQLRPRGFNGGVQGGYNWQFGHLVVGGETDFTWSGMRRTTTVTPITQNNGTPFPGAGFVTTTQKTEWFGTLRPRLGYAAGKFLIYGTAGLAYGNVKNSANTDFRPFGTVQYPGFISKTSAGWTAGGGVEIGITKHLSIKSEYLYYDLGKMNTVASASPALPPFQVGYTWEAKAHTWNAGFNFRF